MNFIPVLQKNEISQEYNAILSAGKKFVNSPRFKKLLRLQEIAKTLENFASEKKWKEADKYIRESGLANELSYTSSEKE